jgi:hypothetical protein
VAEVIEGGERLGIPVDPPGLSRFVAVLRQHGFLAPPGDRPPALTQGPWSRPRNWDEGTRATFREGVRLLRNGRPDEAVARFRAVLAADPESAEAHEMLALVAVGHSLAARPIGEAFQRPDRLTARRASLAPWAMAAAAGLALAGVGAAAWRQLPGRAAAPAAGTLAWADPLPLRLARGEVAGEVRVPSAPAVPGPDARRRLEELEKLAAEDPVYQEFLEKERAAAPARSGRPRAAAIAAPAAGQVTPLVRSASRVAAGALVARVVDPETWLAIALFRGGPPEAGTRCEIAGDGAADRATCQIVEARGTDDGRLAATLAVPSREAPWLERARAPHVLFLAPSPLVRADAP